MWGPSRLKCPAHIHHRYPIIAQIFGHLHPLDLLHLARTTKPFRHVLMHRSSISAWKAARANIPGFPDCPPEMSEPEWANLAFDPHCNVRALDSVRLLKTMYSHPLGSSAANPISDTSIGRSGFVYASIAQRNSSYDLSSHLPNRTLTQC